MEKKPKSTSTRIPSHPDNPIFEEPMTVWFPQSPLPVKPEEKPESKVIKPIITEGTLYKPEEMLIRLVEGGKEEYEEGKLKTREFWGFRRPDQVRKAQIIESANFEEFKVNLEFYLENTNRRCLINAWLKSVPIDNGNFTLAAALVAFMDEEGFGIEGKDGHVFYIPSYQLK